MGWRGLKESVWHVRKRFFLVGETCLICGRLLPPFVSIRICRDCFAQLELVRGQICRHCGRPVRASREVCEKCRKSSNRYISLVRSFGVHENTLQDWLYRVKYYEDAQLAGALGRLMALALGAHPELRCDCLLPVPVLEEGLSWYNPASVLAEEIASWRKIPMFDQIVRPSLVLQAKARNFVGSFQVVRSEPIRGKVVLLVDDIYTTREKLNEIARMLLRAGAREVKGYCCAVSLDDRDLAVSSNE